MISFEKKVLLQEMVGRGGGVGGGVSAPLFCLWPCTVLKDHTPYLTKYEHKGTKISIFKLFSELGKICKCNLGFSKIPISHLFYELGKTWKYTQSQTNVSKSKC